MDENKSNDERINKINEKMCTMKKITDSSSYIYLFNLLNRKHSDSGNSSTSTSFKLTCFPKSCSSKKL